MANLRLPLRFVFDRQPKVLPEHAPCDDPRSTLAFSTTESLIAFLSARQGGKWKLEMANDAAGLLGIAAALHIRNESRLCLDPEPDGSRGETVTLAELLEFSESVRKS